MRRWLSLLLLAVLAACAEPPPRPPQVVDTIQADVVQPGVVCHVGPDGGPVGGQASTVAERGIGGTGAPINWQMTAGQTIIPSTPGQPGGSDVLADRGIGGTGIVGVVTGFASICVNGLEVQYDGAVPVDVDGQLATPGELRAGQVVAIQAGGSADAPKATAISIRTEVAGPIEAVELGSGAVMIAGQRVMVSPSVWGANRFGLGDWTAVSGLRQADGTIAASRLDNARPDRFIVRGAVSLDGGTPHIGSLALDGPAAKLRAGDLVVVSGTFDHGAAHIVTVTPDGLSSNPTGFFGATVNRVIIQAFVRVSRGTIWLNDHLHVPASAGVQADAATSGDAIVTLERNPDGSFSATGLRYTGYRRTGGEESSVRPARNVMAALSPVMVPNQIPITLTPVTAVAPPSAAAAPVAAAAAGPVAAAATVSPAAVPSAPVATPVSAPVAAAPVPISSLTVPATLAAPVAAVSTPAPLVTDSASSASAAHVTAPTGTISSPGISSGSTTGSSPGTTSGSTPGGASLQGSEPTLIISGTGSSGSTSTALVLTGGAGQRGIAAVAAQLSGGTSSGTGASGGASTVKAKTITKPVASGTGHTSR